MSVRVLTDILTLSVGHTASRDMLAQSWRKENRRPPVLPSGISNFVPPALVLGPVLPWAAVVALEN